MSKSFWFLLKHSDFLIIAIFNLLLNDMQVTVTSNTMEHQQHKLVPGFTYLIEDKVYFLKLIKIKIAACHVTEKETYPEDFPVVEHLLTVTKSYTQDSFFSP